MTDESYIYFGKDINSKEYCFSLDYSNLEDYIKYPSSKHLELIQKLKSNSEFSIDENGNPIVVQKKRIWTESERINERASIHKMTDSDYAKYSRQVRMNIDKEHSQAILDYIDAYNLEISDTVNQPGYPQEVMYPEYKLP